MIRRRKQLIYLLGFMGVGKTTVGELLAQRLRWPFIDLDATIESGQGNTIRQIFEQAGEAFFRDIERAALIEASKTEPAVIALGGGTFVQPLNFEYIQEHGGMTVWLDCSLEELRRRCEGKDDRPLFRDPESFARLLEERLPYYRRAHFRISTESRDPEEVAEEILRLSLS
ncbi:MAG: shikimate kinase [Acidobacteriia bacterium]|nr:shikimate kinase [Terriglobia bacterium]